MKLSINDKIEVKNYPYGYKQTSCFFSIEFKDNHGFRMVKQTINPKTNKLNKPKKSTYSQFLYMNNDNGFVKYHSFELYELKDVEKVAKFMSENFDLFTKEQIEYAYRKFVLYSKITIHSMANYCNSDVKTLLKLFEPMIDIAVKGLNTGKNLFSKLSIDVEAIEATEDKDFKPFGN